MATVSLHCPIYEGHAGCTGGGDGGGGDDCQPGVPLMYGGSEFVGTWMQFGEVTEAVDATTTVAP